MSTTGEDQDRRTPVRVKWAEAGTEDEAKAGETAQTEERPASREPDPPAAPGPAAKPESSRRKSSREPKPSAEPTPSWEPEPAAEPRPARERRPLRGMRPSREAKPPRGLKSVGGARPARRSPWSRVPVPSGWRAQSAIAALIALVAVVLLSLSGPEPGDRPDANRALLDGAATTKAVDDVGSALTRVFSYSPTDTAATERAAAEVLTGRAADQYRQLFAQVKRQAPAQRLALTTRVVRAGVTNLSGDTAQLLVFLDQVSTRNGRPAGTVAAAQLSVTAKLVDGRWLITDLRSS